jgi:hypothetical protein
MRTSSLSVLNMAASCAVARALPAQWTIHEPQMLFPPMKSRADAPA